MSDSGCPLFYASAAADNVFCAARRCGLSIILPSSRATPALPAAAKASTIRRAAARSSAPHIIPHRRGACIAVATEAEERSCGLRRNAHDAGRAVLDPKDWLQRVEHCGDALHIGGILTLGQDGLALHHRGEITGGQASVERIDADIELLRTPFHRQHIEDDAACRFLVVGRDRILQILDQRVGIARPRLGELSRAVTRNKQEAAHHASPTGFLIGLISKHAILIVSFANEMQEKEGLRRMEAIRHAAAVRMRPVLMTTAAMVADLVPPLFAGGAGAASRFAIVVVMGMLIGTLFTLFVLPTIYTLLADDHRRTRDDAADHNVRCDNGPTLDGYIIQLTPDSFTDRIRSVD